MHHIEDVSVTVKGLSVKPKTYHLPRILAEELQAYIEAWVDAERIPAEQVLPEAFDAVKGPATALRGARYRHDLTQKKLAEKLGIRQHHLSEMENAKRPIGKEMAKKLSAVLEVDYRLFL